MELTLDDLCENFSEFFEKDQLENTYILKKDFEDTDEKIEIVMKNQVLKTIKEKHSIKCGSVTSSDCVSCRIEGIDLKCSVIIKNVELFKIKNCTISYLERSANNGLSIHSGKAKITDVDICAKEVPCLYLENADVDIKKCSLHDSDCTLLVCSSSTLKCIDSNLSSTSKNGAYVSESTISFNDVNILSTDYPALYCVKTNCIIQNSKIAHIKQNGMTFSNCNRAEIISCNIEDIGSSGISISQSDAVIKKNNIFNIQGNGVYMSESCTVVLEENTVSDCKFPSFAILLSCKVVAMHNHISNMEKSGVCIRSAGKVDFIENDIDGVSECGISISDSTDVKIQNCQIKNCKIACLESYNSSNVTFTDSKLENCGPYAFLVYSGAYIEASHNTISNCAKAICQLRFRGKCKICHNTVLDGSISQYDGHTSGTYLFEDNGSPPVTNIPEEAERLGITPEPVVEDSNGLCLKCGKAKRSCFLQGCGHCIYCMECGKKALENKESCPLCRFPIDGITHGYSSSIEDNVCAICADNKADGIIFPCGHTGVCCECLAKWFNSNDSCPICRVSPAFFKKIETEI